MNELALFAGAGGGILGGILCGFRTVCAVEIDEHARASLMARQNDGCIAPFPIWSDIRSFSARNNATRSAIRRLRRGGIKLVISGGFPCQDVSVAGGGDGLEGVRSGLWKEMRRVIGEIRPRYVFIENSPALTTRGGVRVIAELTALGYDCRWGVVSAADAIWLGGTPCLDHLRERIWIAGARADTNVRWRRPNAAGGNEQNWKAAEWDECDGKPRTVLEYLRATTSGPHTDRVGRKLTRLFRGPAGLAVAERGRARADAGGVAGGRQPQRVSGCAVSPVVGSIGEENPDADNAGCIEQRISVPDGAEYEATECGSWWAAEPALGRMADGVADRVDRLTCTGNGQVPAVVRLAWEILTNQP